MDIRAKWNILARHRVWSILGLLLPTSGAVFAWYVLQGPMVGVTQQLGDLGQEPLRPVSCELVSLLEELREALQDGSPASQRYLQAVVTQVAAAEPFDHLQALVAQERDPGPLEVLAQAVVVRSHTLQRIGDPAELRPLLDRLATEADPALRAALVRPLGKTIEPSQGLYARLIQDPAAEVREAVVANILAEQLIGYGHVPEIAERAIAVAAAARAVDPEAGAQILENVIIKTAGTASVEKVLDLLQADNARLREGAATALGTVGASETHRVAEALVAQYRSEPNMEVRKSIIQAIVHMGFANTIPTLESLRGSDSTSDAEIDVWLAALQLDRQEWEPLLREKERLAKAKGL